MIVIFYIAATLAVLGALGLVFSKNPVHGGLSLVGSFFALGVIYILQNQEFIATIQVLVYAGAIMVLFLFVVMLLNLSKDPHGVRLGWQSLAAGGLAIAFFTHVAVMLGASLPISEVSEEVVTNNSMNKIGEVLFSTYLLPFEVISLLLLVAVVGAVVIAKKYYPFNSK